MQKESTIFIIDDSPEDRAVFRRYLLRDSTYHYSFFEVETGEQGLKLCREREPDCILLDYDLPDINGLEFLEELAGESDTVPFPVVMLTGVESEGVALQAMQRGAQDYLVKGEMSAGNLVRAIHNAIEREAMRRTLEQQHRDLEAKNQELQAFAYALAHDLRAPLRAISGFAQIVMQDYSHVLDEDGRHFVDRIVKSSSQMDQLIDDLLQYTRIEHQPIQYKPVELGYIFQEIVEDMTERLQAAQGTIMLADQLPTVYGDPTLLRQAFTNLLDNALTYVRTGTAALVEVSSETEGSCATISVRDNGIGISPKHYHKIFNIFQRLHGEDEFPGTGIGLAIVKKAIERMNGQVWVKSVVGEGSCFHVKLPLYKSKGTV